MSDIYSIDPGWGGAHVTMTSFKNFSNTGEALHAFSTLKNSLHAKGKPNFWRPQNFTVKNKGTGFRSLEFPSQNLDNMVDKMSAAGWKHTLQKANWHALWHITIASLEGKSFKHGDVNFHKLTNLFSNHHWALVLVHAKAHSNGTIYFHHERGFTLMERATMNQNDMIQV